MRPQDKPPKRIMILHQEGNVNNNPNLTGIIESLVERGYRVDYYGFRRDIPQLPPCEGVGMRLFSPLGRSVTNGFINLDDSIIESPEKTIGFISHVLPRYDLVIGVDRAIIEAELIARLQGIPYGLISYEIYFRSETNAEFKAVEIAACQRLDFAVCQDDLRSGHLMQENKIPKHVMINIPFAGRQADAPGRSNYLRETLGIDKGKKIALIMGSLSEWTMTSYIISSFTKWSRDWALVVHNRYGIDDDARRYFRRFGRIENIYFSTQPAKTPAGMQRIIQSADLGIAFYKPLENNMWAGDNIRHLGMASGKVATFLKYGVPVLLNVAGEMSHYIQQYQMGGVVDTAVPFIPNFTDEQLAMMRTNCHLFFRDHLDLDKTIAPLMNKITSLLDDTNQVHGKR